MWLWRNNFLKFHVFLSSVRIFANFMCVSISLHLCVYVCAHMSVCACASLWYAKYLWNVYQRVQNVKNGICVCVCVYVSVCICVRGVPNIKLVKCKNGICLYVPMSVYVHVSCVWYATYKLSIFGIFANESKSAKCEIF